MASIKVIFSLFILVFSLNSFADVLVPAIPGTSFLQEHVIGLSVAVAIGIILLLIVAYFMRKK